MWGSTENGVITQSHVCQCVSMICWKLPMPFRGCLPFEASFWCQTSRSKQTNLLATLSSRQWYKGRWFCCQTVTVPLLWLQTEGWQHLFKRKVTILQKLIKFAPAVLIYFLPISALPFRQLINNSLPCWRTVIDTSAAESFPPLQTVPGIVLFCSLNRAFVCSVIRSAPQERSVAFFRLNIQ